MNAEKSNIQTGVDAAEIPEYVFESLARSLLPVIQKYYESEVGGDKRDRTADLLNAIQALSQLSYTPMEPEALNFTGLP